jgi:cell division control protein 12
VIAAQGIKVYVPPVDADDEAAAEHSQVLMVSVAEGP